MRKKLLLLTAGTICAALLTSGTVAYFTAEDRAHNVITSGGVEIQLQEWQDTAEGRIPYPGEAVRVMPGTAVSKIATVQNLGADAFIRAKFEVVITDGEGNALDLPREAVTLAMNREDWLRKPGDEQWWYYADIVASGASTEALFTQVAFDGPTMTNEYQGCTIEVIVQAQAVQAANNGHSAPEAAGWPEG